MNMNKEQKLEAIYKEIANKEIIFWCIFERNFYPKWERFRYTWRTEKDNDIALSPDKMIFPNEAYKIIWHPILI